VLGCHDFAAQLAFRDTDAQATILKPQPHDVAEPAAASQQAAMLVKGKENG
jgi:hypothetical protein